MVYEDLTTYTEVDTANVWSETTTRCTGTNVRRDSDSYVYKSYGANHFGDFEHLLDVCVTGVPTDHGYLGMWSLSTAPESLVDLPAGSLVVEMQYVNTGDSRMYLRIWGGATDTWSGFVVGTTYYLRIKRATTAFTCKIYNTAANRDANGATGLIDTLSLTSGTTLFEYVQCGFGGKVADAYAAKTQSGYSENLDLQEAVEAVPASSSIVPIMHGVGMFAVPHKHKFPSFNSRFPKIIPRGLI